MRALPRGIGAKLFLAFSATALPVLLAAGLLLEWQARRALEAELARRVESLATAVSVTIPAETWRLAFSLGPGEEESRTARHLRARLDEVRDATGAERVAVWDLRGRVIAESGSALPIASPAPRGALLETELAIVRSGRATSTPLYRTESGRLVKIGLAPIRGLSAPSPLNAAAGSAPSEESGTVFGALLVEAPAESLPVVRAMQRTLLFAGLGALALVLAAASTVARLLAGRIRHLASVARAMEAGDLDSPVPRLGGDEIGELGGALEAMREAVQARERQLRAMLGGVAHEIRNPLGGLSLYAEMLARDPGLTPEQAGRARRVLSEALRLERVVADFLSFARPERPCGERVSLGALAAESVESARAGIGWNGEASVEVGGEEVWCDEGHLRQVLLNLVRNAMQAAGREGRVRIRRAPASGGAHPPAGGTSGRVTLEIEDSGPGIREADRERVFEPFYSTHAQGAGLGLAIVGRLCRLNGIGIAIGRSELGGALLTLDLPGADETGPAGGGTLAPAGAVRR